MSRLIDADKLLARNREEYGKSKENSAGNFLSTILFHSIVKMIVDAPTVDAMEVVRGLWEKAEYNGFVRCSKCKDSYIYEDWVVNGKWKYCPNCGAKMMDGDLNE